MNFTRIDQTFHNKKVQSELGELGKLWDLVQKKEISGKGYILFQFISCHAWKKSGKIGRNYCTVTPANMAERFNWSIPTIKRTIKELESLKLIKRVFRVQQGKKNIIVKTEKHARYTHVQNKGKMINSYYKILVNTYEVFENKHKK